MNRLQEGIIGPKEKIRRHQHTAILCFNVLAGTTPRQLLEGFEALAERIRVLKQGRPEREQEPWLIAGNPFALTATWAFGASLFDRPEFGLAPLKPRGLRRMPDSFPMEERDEGFDRALGEADLLIQFSCAHFFPLFRAVNSVTKPGRLPFALAGYHRGFQRADDRGMLRFFDGTSNLSPKERETLVPTTGADQRQDWCDGGTFMVFRKLREDVREWEALDQAEQERRIGRRKVDGFPLGAPEGLPHDHPTFREPDFIGENRQVPLESHVRKMNPRQGVSPATKIFRRGWPYFDGFALDGRMLAGLLFVSYQRDLGSFEIIRSSWMPHGFPSGGTPADGILRSKVIHLVTGGYYFVPRRSTAFPGADMFRRVLRGASVAAGGAAASAAGS